MLGGIRVVSSVAGVLFAAAAAAQDINAKGYVQEPDDQFQTYAFAPRYRAFLPPEVDLSARFPRPGNQGQQSSCTAWATTYAMRSYYAGQRNGWTYSGPDQLLSPAMIYNKLRLGRPNPGADCMQGTSIAQALELLKTDGVVPLSVFPYSEKECGRMPDGATLNAASQYRIRSWRALAPGQLDDAKGQLAAGHPVVFGMNVSDSFDRLKGATVYDDTASPRTGGHAMVLVGYSEERQAFKLINSWGTRWGDGGFGWVSYRAMKELTQRMFVVEVDGQVAPPVSPFKPEPAPAPVPAPAPAPVPVVTPPPPPTPEPAPVVVTPPPAPAPAPAPAPVVIAPPPVKPAAPLTAEELQRRVDRGIERLACARVEGRVSAERAISLRGFVGSGDELAKLQSDLRALPGAGRVDADVAVHPWPQCEVHLNFADALKAGGLSAQMRGATGGPVFKERDSLSLEITTPAFPAYVYVSYIQASGEVAHLHWPQGRFPRPLAPNSKLVLGGGANGQPVYRVGAPFGDEIIVVIASASPLFREELPESSSEREYLTSFRKAFALRPKDESGARLVSAVALPLRTEK